MLGLMPIINKQKIFVSILLLQLIQFLLQAECKVHEYMNVSYVLNYSYGKGSRLLIGSLVDFLFRGHLTTYRLYLFYLVFLVVAMVLTSLVFTRFIYETNNKNRFCGKVFFALLFLLGPSSLKYLERSTNVGRFDLYLLIIVLTGIFIMVYIKPFCLQMLLLTAISCLALSIHQIFFSIFLPLFGVYVLYHFLFRKRKWYDFMVVLLCLIVVGGVFAYFQFFAQLNYQSFPELMTVLENRTDLPLSEFSVEYEYFKTIRDHLVNLQWIRGEENGYVNCVDRMGLAAIQFIQLSPLLVIFFGIWKRILDLCKPEARKQYITLFLPILLYIPAFIIAFDWLRWIAAMLIMITYMLILLYLLGETAVKSTFLQFGEMILDNRLLSCSILLYICSLDAFGANSFNPQTLGITHNFNFSVALLLFVILYDIVIYNNYFKRENSLFSLISLRASLKRRRNSISQYKTFYTRLLIYTACFTTFFLINPFYVLIYENQESLINIVGPFLMIWSTFILYIYMMRFWGVSIQNEQGEIVISAVLRYLLSVVLLLGIMFLQHGFFFSAAEQLVYLRSDNILKWYYPFLLSTAVFFDYKKSRQFFNLTKGSISGCIIAITGLFLMWSEGGISSINLLTWDSLYSSMKYAAAICLMGVILYQYYIKKVSSKISNDSV